MITPQIVNDDIVINGEMHVGDKVPGLCCPGFDWEVSAIFSDVWGNCTNPNCPVSSDPYKGVSHKDIYDIADWMLDHPVSV